MFEVYWNGNPSYEREMRPLSAGIRTLAQAEKVRDFYKKLLPQWRYVIVAH